MHIPARIALDRGRNLVFVLGDDDVSRVSLAFRAKGFYIGSDLVDLIFEHEVHYQSPEFTTTSASNTADCNVQQIPPRGTTNARRFLPRSPGQNSLFASYFNSYVVKHRMLHKVEENRGEAGWQGVALPGAAVVEEVQAADALLDARVIENRSLGGGYFILRLGGCEPLAGSPARTVVMLRGDWGRDPLLPRPLSLLSVPHEGRADLLAKVVGKGNSVNGTVSSRGREFQSWDPLATAFPRLRPT